MADPNVRVSYPLLLEVGAMTGERAVSDSFTSHSVLIHKTVEGIPKKNNQTGNICSCICQTYMDAQRALSFFLEQGNG